ncbi:MAG: thiamine phosphate synthase [Rhodospirillaceae bacterium]|nr:thiamine phosphate synthase [Rhodospirillaceae bacterium]
MRDPCRLYLITPPEIELESFAPALEAALDAGDVACLQLRLKEADDDTVRRSGERLLPICEARDVPLLINDRPDLAARIGAAGAHVGAEDASYAEARERLGAEGMVGVSCYDSRHRAMEAAASGADYVAFGAFFPTETKTPRAKADLHLLKWWSTLMVVPCVAIGGITAENCGPLVENGADFLAVIGGVWSHPDGPEAGVRAINGAIASAGAS